MPPTRCPSCASPNAYHNRLFTAWSISCNDCGFKRTSEGKVVHGNAVPDDIVEANKLKPVPW